MYDLVWRINFTRELEDLAWLYVASTLKENENWSWLAKLPIDLVMPATRLKERWSGGGGEEEVM